MRWSFAAALVLPLQFSSYVHAQVPANERIVIPELRQLLQVDKQKQGADEDQKQNDDKDKKDENNGGTEQRPPAQPPQQWDVKFSESDFQEKPWLQEFEWVIVVNKAAKGIDRESIKIYHKQQLVTADEIAQALPSDDNHDAWLKNFKKEQWSDTSFKVSSGRETFEPAGKHNSKHDNYTITPTGFFTVQKFEEKHKSEEYSEVNCGDEGDTTDGEVNKKCVYMEKVIFFNKGIALHKVIDGTQDALGERASGGCVRMPEAVSSYLFENLPHSLVKTNPKVNNDGTVEMDEKGEPARIGETKSVWGPIEAHSVLIIVQDQIVRKGETR